MAERPKSLDAGRILAQGLFKAHKLHVPADAGPGKDPNDLSNMRIMVNMDVANTAFYEAQPVTGFVNDVCGFKGQFPKRLDANKRKLLLFHLTGVLVPNGFKRGLSMSKKLSG